MERLSLWSCEHLDRPRAMKLALASCSNLPGWEVDDAPFHEALERLGFELAHPAWDDEYVDWSAFDACLIRTTWDYMDRQEAYVDWAQKVARCCPFFNPPEIISWNTKKTYLRELAQQGVPIAPTFFYEPGDQVDLVSVLRETGWERAFLKPVVGATARETLRFEASEVAQAQAHLDRLLQREGMMLQPYLASVEEVGELSAIFLGGSFSHAVRKIPVAGDYRVQDDFGATDFPVTLSEDELGLARRIHALAQERCQSSELLYARVDWLTGDDGQLLLTELELVEPSLFFRHSPEAGNRLAQALMRALQE